LYISSAVSANSSTVFGGVNDDVPSTETRREDVDPDDGANDRPLTAADVRKEVVPDGTADTTARKSEKEIFIVLFIC
jgi:hypothetical protein